MAHRRVDATQRADGARLDDFHDVAGEGVVPPVERFHHDEIGPCCSGGGDASGFRSIRSERLLAEHVLACFERTECPAPVEAIRQRVVHRIDRWVVDQRVVGVEHGRKTMFGRERRSLRRVASRHTDDLDVGARSRWLDECCGRDARRAENPDPHHDETLRLCTQRPVDPCPPSPRSVSSSESTSCHATVSTRCTTNCAIRSPRVTTNGVESS